MLAMAFAGSWPGRSVTVECSDPEQQRSMRVIMGRYAPFTSEDDGVRFVRADEEPVQTGGSPGETSTDDRRF